MMLSQKSLGRLRADLLSITPEVTAIIGDLIAAEKTSDGGAELLRAYAGILLEKRYGGLLKILSVLVDSTPEALEDKTAAEIADMAAALLNDRTLLRFFPQLGRWARKTPSDI